MSKPLIISFASKGREDYLGLSETLYRSVKDHWKHDYLFYTMDGNRDEFEGIKLIQVNELPQPSTWECKPHKEVPYQFKFGLIDHAREMGYNQIIWMDSTISIVKCPLHLLQQSPKGVMCFHNLGFETFDYISDDCIKKLGSSYLEVDNAPQIWGGCIGFDFTKESAANVFERVVRASKDGAFNDGGSERKNFIAHRHDQSVMSVLFHRHGVFPYNYGHIVNNVHNKEPFEYGTYHSFVYGKY